MVNLDSIPRSVAWKTQSPVAHLSLMFRVFARMMFPKLRDPFFRSVCFCGEFLYVHRIEREKRSSHSKSIGKLCTFFKKNVHLSFFPLAVSALAEKNSTKQKKGDSLLP